MSLNIYPFVLGMLENNTYLLADSATLEAVVIDPAANSQRVLDEIKKRSLKLSQIWLTHAHFDHTAGVSLIVSSRQPSVPICMHPDDLELYKNGGGAANFGIKLGVMPDPSIFFHDGEELKLGASIIEVRHTPGHSPGHVVFYAKEISVVFCGDLIFRYGIGRTDFPEGNHEMLIKSIRNKILTLPSTTKLLPGHGPETTVAFEAKMNPFLS
jgi:hydroxyacylglutathione hydrolase